MFLLIYGFQSLLNRLSQNRERVTVFGGEARGDQPDRVRRHSARCTTSLCNQQSP